MERPFSIHHFDHKVLRVKDLKKSVAFYTEVLGGEIVIQRDDEVSIEMDPHMRITLTEADDVHFCFAVEMKPEFDTAVNVVDDEVDKMRDYFRSHDLKIVGEEIQHTAPVVRCLDPDDNVVEFRLNGYDAAALQEGGLRKQ